MTEVTAMTEYTTDEYVTTKDAENLFEVSALDMNTMLRVCNVPRVATFKRQGQKGRPANLYRRAHVERLVQHIRAFSVEG